MAEKIKLQNKFPHTYALCAKRKRKYKPDIVTTNEITYDRSVLPILTQIEIEHFIELQKKYPETINECFNNLIKILEQGEKRLTLQNKKIKQQNYNYMGDIFNSLNNLKIFKDAYQIDKWILFIKSQDDFSVFF